MAYITTNIKLHFNFKSLFETAVHNLLVCLRVTWVPEYKIKTQFLNKVQRPKQCVKSRVRLSTFIYYTKPISQHGVFFFFSFSPEKWVVLFMKRCRKVSEIMYANEIWAALPGSVIFFIDLAAVPD